MLAGIVGYDELKNAHNFSPEMPEDLVFLYHAEFFFLQTTFLFDVLETKYKDHVRNIPKDVQKKFDENLKRNLQIICKNSGKTKRK